MAKRTYTTDAIEVLWNSERCVHTGICLKTLPEVFDTSRRPWVTVDAAEADAIAAAIERCPSGALAYRRLDGRSGEVPPAETTIVPWPNGPLYVRGSVEVRDRRGELFAAGTRMALCRCGHSQNQPFCDLSHREAGFKNNPRVIPPRRETAQSPGEIDE